ncbi:MAG: hypothetical protein ACYS83_11915 [Planctomycetota bacterium]
MSNGMREEQMQEVQGVVSPGARVQTFSCKVKSLVSHNVYKVRMVEIGAPGSLPVELGSEMEAVDVTDDFLNPASNVPIGSIVVLSRVGSKYVFQKP